MEFFIKISLFIHVLAGTGSLLFGAIAILLKRNTPKHKPIGKIYFWCMTVVFITSMYLSVFRSNLFLFLVGVFTYYAICISYRSLKLKELNITQKPALIDWIIEVIAAAAFVGMIGFAIAYYLKHQSMEAVIPLFFGVLGFVGGIKNVRRLKAIPQEKNEWLRVHIGNMCGSYIGAITAFFVNQGEYIPVSPIVLWLGPTILIVPIIIIETKKLKTQ